MKTFFWFILAISGVSLVWSSIQDKIIEKTYDTLFSEAATVKDSLTAYTVELNYAENHIDEIVKNPHQINRIYELHMKVIQLESATNHHLEQIDNLQEKEKINLFMTIVSVVLIILGLIGLATDKIIMNFINRF